MNIDPTAIAYGFVGLAAGAGVHFWKRKAELEERCDFMTDMGAGLNLAFDNVDDLLQDKHLPKPIREAILFLLSAHADPKLGKRFAGVILEDERSEAPDGKDPISQSMTVLGRHNPALARQTHQVLATLSFSLVFLNAADVIRVERVRDAAAQDPVSLWARIAQLFKGGDDHHAGGDLLHA
ncbi:MAG TPA: hypothetical protein VMF90_12225 [Rhizobiaceae bacterium]|nr:hypothetical protein [Rhizobiaceae bacterium]